MSATTATTAPVFSIDVEAAETATSTIQKAKISVSVEGDRAKPAIVTFHDVGLDHKTCFESFLQNDGLKKIFDNFCIYHLDAPGQQEGTMTIEASLYPTFDELIDQIHEIVEEYKITDFIGMGVGAGGTLLCNYGVKYMTQSKMKGLVMISATPLLTPWSEYLFQKASTWTLNQFGMNDFAKSQLLSRYFSPEFIKKNDALMQKYRSHFDKINVQNLVHFVNSYIQRSVDIVPLLPHATFATTIFIGSESPYVDDITESYSEFEPSTRSRLEIQDASVLITVEKPEVFAQPLELFLIALGHKIPVTH